MGKIKQQVRVVYFNATKCFLTIKELEVILAKLEALFSYSDVPDTVVPLWLIC